MSTFALTTAFLAIPLAAALASAQDSKVSAAGAARPLPAFASGFGLGQVDGEWIGIGPDYRVRFGAQGFEFTAALGESAPRAASLELQLDSIERGTQLLWSAGGPRALRAFGRELRAELGAGLVERHELRGDGLELALLVSARPAGSGDLVARYRVATDLLPPAEGEHADALRFGLGASGGISVGAVTGIDADGRSYSGRCVWDGASLAFVLPQDCVESARYPLLLDPLFGAQFGIGGLGADDRDVDVAFSASASNYLAVWGRRVSAAQIDVIGQRIDSAGLPLGSPVSLASGPGLRLHPAVAHVESTGQYLAVWQEGAGPFGPWDVRARSLDAATGAMTAAALLASTAADELEPDLGGQLDATNQAVLVYRLGQSGIRAQRVSVPAGAVPVPAGPVLTVSTASGDAEPAISKNGGVLGRHLVCWTTSVASQKDVRGLVVGASGALGGAVDIAANAGVDEQQPDCDGDGSRFAVVWRRGPPTAGDIHCAVADFTAAPNQLTVAPGQLIGFSDAAADEFQPAVARLATVADAGAVTHTKFSATWAHRTLGLQASLRTTGLLVSGASGATLCTQCDQTDEQVVGTTGIERVEAAAGLTSTSGNGALLAWSTVGTTLPFTGQLKGLEWFAFGATTPLAFGGECGGGQLSLPFGTRLGTRWSVQLSGALPLKPVFFVFELAAGSSTLLPGCPDDGTGGSTCKTLDSVLPLFQPPAFNLGIASAAGALAPSPFSPLSCDPALAGLKVWVQTLQPSFATDVPPAVCVANYLLTGIRLSTSNIVETTLEY